MGKFWRTAFISLVFIGILLGIIIANIGWPAFLAILHGVLVNLAQALKVTPPG
jgi:hypothetical protein